MAYNPPITVRVRHPFRMQPGGSLVAGLATPFRLSLILVGALLLAGLGFLSRTYLEAALIGLLVSLGLMFLIATTLHGRVNGALLTWLVISPLAYYFLSIPIEKPVFTFDRFIILMLSGAILFVPRDEAVAVPWLLQRAAIAWGLFILFAFTSLVPVWEDLGVAGTRLITEAFIFPGLMALFVIRVFPAQRYIRPMHTLIGLMAIYSSTIGFIELLTNRDLLPLPGAIFYDAGQTGTIARVNGPFEANYCFAMVGAISLFLLFFLRSLMEGKIGQSRKYFHWVAVTAAITMALLPQFRTLAIALAIVLFLELYHNKRVSARVAVVAVVILLTFAIISLPIIAPAFFESRIADPSNFYARVAQQQQTWDLFRQYPINGAGFANFMQAIQSVSSTSFHDVDAVNSAHNSLASVLAETGLAGVLPFVAANVFWFLAFLQLKKRKTPVAAAAFRYFLYIFLCYWLMGFTLTSAYDRDLNLWYMFACALLYKFSLVEQQALTSTTLAFDRER